MSSPHNSVGSHARNYTIAGLPAMSLSGLVPGILANRLSLRTRPPVGEEDEEVGDADGAVVVEVRGTGRKTVEIEEIRWAVRM